MSSDQNQSRSQGKITGIAMDLAGYVNRRKKQLSKILNQWFNQWALQRQWQLLCIALILCSSLLALSLWLIPFGYQSINHGTRVPLYIGKPFVMPRGSESDPGKRDSTIHNHK